MPFLAPLYLLGLLAVAVPLVVHLRRSRRTRRIVFSTTRFFDEQFMRSARRARLQDLLLMFMRMAVLALFALALAQPFVRFGALGVLSGLYRGSDVRHVVLVIDDSASMRVISEHGTLLDRAKRGAVTVLDELLAERGDQVTVVLAGRRDGGPKSLFDPTTSDIPSVRDAIERIEPTDLGTDLGGAIDTALRLLGTGTGRETQAGALRQPDSGDTAIREVFVFSDLRQEVLPPPVPETVAVFFVSTTVEPDVLASNISIDALQYDAPRPMAGVPFTFRALVTNHAPRDQYVALNLVVADQVMDHRKVQLPSGRAKVVRFVNRFSRPGWVTGRVELDPSSGSTPGGEPGSAVANDSMPADNQRYFALHVQGRSRVLAVNGAPSDVNALDELFFFETALRAGVADHLPGAGADDVAGVDLQVIAPADITPALLDGYPIVLLANVPKLSEEALVALEQYVDGGGSLILTLGDRVEASVYAGWSGGHRLHGGLLPARIDRIVRGTDPADQPLTLTWVNDSHPMTVGFHRGALGSLSSVRLSGYGVVVPLDVRDQRTSRVLASSANGQPVLIEKMYGRGRVLLFVSTIDRDWTNLPVQPVFVPWTHRMVSYLSQPATARGGFIRTGAHVAFSVSSTATQQWHVRNPDGGVAYPRPAMNTDISPTSGDLSHVTPAAGVASKLMVLTQTDHAGVYDVRSAASGTNAGSHLRFAANLPHAESSPRLLTSASVRDAVGPSAVWIDAPEQVVEHVASARQGYGLWNALLVLALMVALVEPWLANWLSNKRRTRDRVPAPRHRGRTEEHQINTRGAA